MNLILEKNENENGNKLVFHVTVKIPLQIVKKGMPFSKDQTVKEVIEDIIDQLIPDPRLKSIPSEYTLSCGPTNLELSEKLWLIMN